MSSSITANSVGYNESQAKGLSIYYPDPTMPTSAIDESYPLTLFAQQSQWLRFIRENRQ